MTNELEKELEKIKSIKKSEYIKDEKKQRNINKLNESYEGTLHYQYKILEGQIQYINGLNSEGLKKNLKMIRQINEEHEEYKKYKPILEEIIKEENNDTCIEKVIEYLKQKINQDGYLDEELYEYKHILLPLASYYKDVLEEIIKEFEKKEENSITQQALNNYYENYAVLSENYRNFKQSLLHNITIESLEKIKKLCKAIEANQEGIMEFAQKLKDKQPKKRY